MPNQHDSPDQRIYQQIEQTADYYSPGIYDLLSKYDRLTTAEDSAAAQYVPISTVAFSSGANPKKFVVGILPPTSTPTNRLLDRSASVRGKGEPPPTPVAGSQSTSTGSTPVGLYPGATEDHLTPDGKTGFRRGVSAPLNDQWWINYVEMCERLKVRPEDLATIVNSESGFNTTSVAVRDGHNVAKGLNQLTLKTAQGLGMSEEEWASYDRVSGDRQQFWMERYFQRAGVKGKNAAQLRAANFGGYQNRQPEGSRDVQYASYAYQDAHGGRELFPDSAFQDKAFRDNASLSGDQQAIRLSDMEADVAKHPAPTGIVGRIQAAQAAIQHGAKSTAPESQSPFASSPGATTKWAKGGSDAKNVAKDTLTSVANTTIDLNDTTVGRALQAAQAAVIQETQLQLDIMAKTPPLQMLVNPSSFKVSSEKVIADGNYGRYGPIVEQWGDNQDKIEGSGKVAGFYALDAAGGVGPGLTRMARGASEAYQNFLSLYLLYKSNGALWLNAGNDALGIQSNSLSVLGSVYLYYDNILYTGSFDTFSISETDDKPFTLEYSFSFTVRATFLFDNVDSAVIAGRQANPNSAPPLSTTQAQLPGDPTSDAEIARFLASEQIAKGEPASDLIQETSEVLNESNLQNQLRAGFGGKQQPVDPSIGSYLITTPKKGKGSK